MAIKLDTIIEDYVNREVERRVAANKEENEIFIAKENHFKLKKDLCSHIKKGETIKATIDYNTRDVKVMSTDNGGITTVDLLSFISYIL
jgi:hypothetical protein